MTFADLPAGTAVFVDANIFVYHFVSHHAFGLACRDLLERVQRQELIGFTSTHVVSEMAHRLMGLEACAAFGWPYPGFAHRLKRHPAQVQKLTRCRQAIDEVGMFGIQILAIIARLVSLAAGVSQQTGLLSSDGLIVGVMREHGLTHLASHDADFDRVPAITRYAPA